MHERREYFEVNEANSMVPTLEFYFAELARIQREVNEVVQQAGKLGVTIQTEGDPVRTGNALRDRLQEKCAVLASEYADIIDEVHELGVVIEDPDLGTVNFYALVDGEEVVLSWQFGEPEVGHWFKVSEDFMARRPLYHEAEPNNIHPPVH